MNPSDDAVTAGSAGRSQRRRLTILLAMNVAMIAGLLIVGFLTRSLGVLAAGGDYVADSSAILLGIIAVAVRERVGRHSKAPSSSPPSTPPSCWPSPPSS